MGVVGGKSSIHPAHLLAIDFCVDAISGNLCRCLFLREEQNDRSEKPGVSWGRYELHDLEETSQHENKYRLARAEGSRCKLGEGNP